MVVHLFKMKSDSNCFNKVKELITSLECSINLPYDVESPTLIIQGDYVDCNYIYIPHFKRYYFVTKVTGLSDDLLQFDCISDVLCSNNITSLVALVERQEFKRNTQIIDSELISQANNNFYCRQVGNPVNANYNIYLTTCGGVS